MTEYWVSQGNKWCDFCKIFISNNPLSIRTHELGERHKDNVAKRLATMQKESAAKEKQHKEAARALEQIEAKAKRSYLKDLASFKASKPPDEWELDAASGYYHNQTKGYHYDPKTDLFYSNDSGKWITQEEAFKTAQISRPDVCHSTESNKGKLISKSTQDFQASSSSGGKSGPAPGLVISKSLNPLRSVKGAAASSIAVNKRKREVGKTKPISKEEAAALKAREAAKKRVEEREKPLMGLYKSY